MMKITCQTLLALTLLCGLAAWAQDSASPSANPAPDNTKVNQRDRRGDLPTADQQNADPADLDLTRNIRQALVKDKSLSTDAHNIKIITQDGLTTLRGPVKNAHEKMAIEQKAVEVAGSPAKVRNQLEVTGEAGSKPSPDSGNQQ